MPSIVELSAVGLAEAIASGDVSATEALEAYLAAIEETEPQVCAYNEVLTDQARTAAAGVDAARAAGTRQEDIAPRKNSMKHLSAEGRAESIRIQMDTAGSSGGDSINITQANGRVMYFDAGNGFGYGQASPTPTRPDQVRKVRPPLIIHRYCPFKKKLKPGLNHHS